MYHPGMMSNAHHPSTGPGMPGYPSQSHPQYNHGAPHHAQLQERAPIPPTQSPGTPVQPPGPPGPAQGQPGSHHGTPPSVPQQALSEQSSPNFQRTNHASPLVQPTQQPNSQSAPRGHFPNPASTASPSSGSPMTQPQVKYIL